MCDCMTDCSFVQVISALAPNVKSLTSYQRHPQYSVPSGEKPQSKESREEINRSWPQIWDNVKNSALAFGFEESKQPSFAEGVTEEDRQKTYEEAWQHGGGFNCQSTPTLCIRLTCGSQSCSVLTTIWRWTRKRTRLPLSSFEARFEKPSKTLRRLAN